jgi:diguanylate cyclase (GGDEF)-like protein
LVRDDKGQPAFFIAQLQDISERRKLEEQVREASLLDELTGLQNRRGFMLLGDQALTSAARYRRGMVLLFADLNGLKKANDQLGHGAGDQLLVAMAETMRATFRRADILARLGGDEFVLLAEGDETFAALAEVKLHKAIESYNARTRGSYPLSASIGSVAFACGDNITLRELLATADARMYAAKRQYKASNPAESAAEGR